MQEQSKYVSKSNLIKINKNVCKLNFLEWSVENWNENEMCVNICKIEKNVNLNVVYNQTFAGCRGADNSGNQPPTAAGGHHAVCSLLLGIFKHIDTFCAYRTSLIFPFIFFFLQ